MTSTIGIPIKLLNEAQVSPLSHPAILYQVVARNQLLTSNYQGHVVTLEISSGQVYRGKLLEGVWSLSFSESTLCVSRRKEC